MRSTNKLAIFPASGDASSKAPHTNGRGRMAAGAVAGYSRRWAATSCIYLFDWLRQQAVKRKLKAPAVQDSCPGLINKLFAEYVVYVKLYGRAL